MSGENPPKGPPAAPLLDSVPRDALSQADEAASVAHDFIWGQNGVTKEQADGAIWRIHNMLRPLIDPSGETWRLRRRNA